SSEGSDFNMSPPAGYTEIFEGNNSNDAKLVAAYRYATGDESGTVNFSGSSIAATTWVAYRISGAADPGVQVPEVSSASTGDSSSPNPNSVTPTGGPKDFLFIAAFDAEGASSVNSYPSNYT